MPNLQTGMSVGQGPLWDGRSGFLGLRCGAWSGMRPGNDVPAFFLGCLVLCLTCLGRCQLEDVLNIIGDMITFKVQITNRNFWNESLM